MLVSQQPMPEHDPLITSEMLPHEDKHPVTYVLPLKVAYVSHPTAINLFLAEDMGKSGRMSQGSLLFKDPPDEL